MEVATPEVRLIGMSGCDVEPMEDAGMLIDLGTEPAEDLAEFAGRACYQSFGRPNPATRDTRDYLANILKQGHESVLEHTQFTFYLTGVSRALTHELIRHRHLSYSQLSQRFVDESDMAIVIPPAIRDSASMTALLKKQAKEAVKTYTDLTLQLMEQGLGRKQAREAARAVLPNCAETRIVVTGNARAWRDYLKKRLSSHADAEIREVSQMIFDKLNEEAPGFFQDREEWNID